MSTANASMSAEVASMSAEVASIRARNGMPRAVGAGVDLWQDVYVYVAAELESFLQERSSL